MVRHASKIVRVVLPLAVLVGSGSCGGDKKGPSKPIVKTGDDKKPPIAAETEADREKKRRAAAMALVPDGTTCFPPALKEANAPKLELAAVGPDAIICANDTDRARLLGPIACWKVDLAESGLAYKAPEPLPGRNVTVKLDDRCARGHCLPKAAKLPEDKIVHMAWNIDGSKAVVIAGDEAHIFDATAKSRESGFTIRGDNGVTDEPTGVIWVGDAIFVQNAANVFAFKVDGTAVGPLTTLGGKEVPLSTKGGSFMLLGETRVGVSEKGFSTVTSYELVPNETDPKRMFKRTKIVRKVTTGPCKPAEIEAFWNDAEVPAKCKDHMAKTFGHLMGADAVAGKTGNLLALLRGSRLGELAVLDANTLVEKKTFKLPWCDGGDAGGASAGEPAVDEKSAKAAPPPKKAAKKAEQLEDPDAGGE